ncbi:MAG: ABC transporter permease [Candidatus Nanohaloarchaea archaeon]
MSEESVSTTGLASIRKHAAVYWHYFKQYWKTRLVYKTDFLLNSLSQMLNLATSLAFLTLIFTQVNSINGWTFNEMLFLAGIGGLSMNIHHIFMLHITNLGEDYVVTGDLDRFKVRPLNVLFQVYASNVRDENVPKLVTNAALIIYASGQMGLNLLQPEFLIYGIPVIVSSIFTFGSIYLAISTLGFWMARSRPLVWIVFRLSDFRRYPFSIYSRPIQIILVTLVPLAFASFFPATFFLGKEGWETYQYLSLIAGPLTYGVAYGFWKYGLSKYTSTGS